MKCVQNENQYISSALIQTKILQIWYKRYKLLVFEAKKYNNKNKQENTIYILYWSLNKQKMSVIGKPQSATTNNICCGNINNKM